MRISISRGIITENKGVPAGTINCCGRYFAQSFTLGFPKDDMIMLIRLVSDGHSVSWIGSDEVMFSQIRTGLADTALAENDSN